MGLFMTVVMLTVQPQILFGIMRVVGAEWAVKGFIVLCIPCAVFIVAPVAKGTLECKINQLNSMCLLGIDKLC